MTNGTQGYEHFISIFIEASQSLDFYQSCKDYLSFLPKEPADILDVGAGAGQNSAALARLGYRVKAIEPMPDFLAAARATYSQHPIEWRDDSLPHLVTLDEKVQFDFILVEGVWHHLDESERAAAIARLSVLTKQQGLCAISLRNGPAGMGIRVFPTDALQTIEQFKHFGFECIFCTQNQPSIYSFKENVFWSRIVLRKLPKSS
ncbi:class I SAM-dependent methyltransferase [Cellvibrio fibrivorans]|uniref:2-polyprenyl-3-methyl-5-hydroxy-6-metoxy-1, 4-benzoquinol methylase n=1 Tax=Cellvibrio fibrivorans TaxID=126350 RepID=A0ABU1V3H3_9GAMM|nr:class I SAM-dependent methyltransferase [Cellvibrio fibrivorans]MDR7091898.1 2-polyprenyl-3-methyl-5-hydroxy-6-metoxy-1,4-benzoquinol methylase [Cellvibrio fibrivorans]